MALGHERLEPFVLGGAAEMQREISLSPPSLCRIRMEPAVAHAGMVAVGMTVRRRWE